VQYGARAPSMEQAARLLADQQPFARWADDTL
jgi:hypothetical protein